MKALIITVSVLLTWVSVFPQAPTDGAVRISGDAMASRVIKREFRDVPEEVLEFHARGKIRLKIWVDNEGKVTKTVTVVALGDRATEFVHKAVSTWKFRPLEIDGKPVAFFGTIDIPFCYGSFTSSRGGLCGKQW